MPDFSKQAVTYPDAPDWWTSDEWATPLTIIATLEAEFGPFDLDPCAREDTAKGRLYYTKEDDGLVQPWQGHVFVNPPYSAPDVWIKKAIAEIEAERATQVILLLAAATDTGWFHDLLLPYADIRFLRGRVRFIDWCGNPAKNSPQAGSLIARIPTGLTGLFHC
jgi:site-specific DNA-methyltransferase (adenine-specific)